MGTHEGLCKPIDRSGHLCGMQCALYRVVFRLLAKEE